MSLFNKYYIPGCYYAIKSANPQHLSLCSHFKVIFFVHGETGAEHIARYDHVRLVSVHCEAVHAQELRQQCVAMALHYILQTEKNTINETPAYQSSP